MILQCINRPSAGSGWWLSYLLVVAYLVNCWKLERSASFEYTFSTIITFGLLLQTEYIHFGTKINNQIMRWILYLVPAFVTSSLLFWILKQGLSGNYANYFDQITIALF